MAKQRYISTLFWTDSWVQSLDPSEKLLYVYLLTGPLTNIAGVYEISIKQICFDTGYNDETIKNIFKKFENERKVFYRYGYIIIPNWPKHQKYNQRSKIKTGIELILNALPEKLIKALHEADYQYPLDTLSIPYTYLRNYSDPDSDSDSDIKTPPPPPKSDFPKKQFPKPDLGPDGVVNYFHDVSKIIHTRYRSMMMTNSGSVDHVANVLRHYGNDALIFVMDGLSQLSPAQYNNPRFVYKFLENRKDRLRGIKDGKLDITGKSPEKKKKNFDRPYGIPSRYSTSFVMIGTDGNAAKWWVDEDIITTGSGKKMQQCIREDNRFEKLFPVDSVRKYQNYKKQEN